MQNIQVRTNDLWYTDDPYRSGKRLESIREKNGTEQLSPIILCACTFQYDGDKRHFAIIDGNRRAFVDNKTTGFSQAKLVENDKDLEAIMKELPKDHGLRKRGLKHLSDVVQGYKQWLPRQYSQNILFLY